MGNAMADYLDTRVEDIEVDVLPPKGKYHAVVTETNSGIIPNDKQTPYTDVKVKLLEPVGESVDPDEWAAANVHTATGKFWGSAKAQKGTMKQLSRTFELGDAATIGEIFSVIEGQECDVVIDWEEKFGADEAVVKFFNPSTG